MELPSDNHASSDATTDHPAAAAVEAVAPLNHERTIPSPPVIDLPQLSRMQLLVKSGSFVMAVAIFLLAITLRGGMTGERPVVYGATKQVQFRPTDPIHTTAFLYCHEMRDRSVERQWMREQRVQNRLLEGAYSDFQSWHSRRCIPLPSAAHVVNDTFMPYVESALRLPGIAHVENLTRRYAPQVRSVVVDNDGEVYYPVTMHDGHGSLRQALVAHNQLCSALDAYWNDLISAIGPYQPKRLPCICPADLHMVHTEMMFLLDREDFPRPKVSPTSTMLECNWTILLNVRREGHPIDEALKFHVDFGEKLHRFPAHIDRVLLGEVPDSLVFQRTEWLSALHPTAFFEPETLRKIEDASSLKGPGRRPYLLRELSEMEASAGGGGGSDDPSLKHGSVGILSSGDVPGVSYQLFDPAYRAYGRRFHLDEAPYGRVQQRTSSETAMCYAKCQYLENALSGVFAYGDRPSDALENAEDAQQTAYARKLEETAAETQRLQEEILRQRMLRQKRAGQRHG